MAEPKEPTLAMRSAWRRNARFSLRRAGYTHAEIVQIEEQNGHAEAQRPARCVRGRAGTEGGQVSYYADEQYAVYHEVRVFASKQHDCDAVLCSEPIRKGDPYWRISMVHDGRAETVKRCVRCQAIHLHLRGLGDDTWPDERLACGQDYTEEWGRDPPPEISALAFWKPGEPLPCDERCVYTDPGRMPTLQCWDWRTRWHRDAQTAYWHTCGRNMADHTQPCTAVPP